MSEPVGSVSVRVVPDATGFKDKLEGDLTAGASEIGAQLGRNIGTAMAQYFGAELDKMKADLDELGLRSPDIRVKVNDDGSIAETEAKLAALDATADEAGGDGGGIDLLGSRLLNIGALAVAGADVAIPALLAIGAAAAGILAGAGVLALGFSGIGAALTASQQKPTGSAASAPASSGLSAQQQELTAKEATASAAQELTSALESQKNAEVSLGNAQTSALQAQKDLTAARVQAIQDMQDLSNSVIDNSLSQQQAAITLAQAKSTLALDLAAPGAGLPQYAQQIQEAKLAVAQAQQQLNELSLTGSRLKTQQSTSNRQGVNGAPGVVSAQQNVVQSQQQLASAQQNVADAANKVAQAQQNVTDTSLKNSIAAQQAAISMGNAAAGTDAFATALAKLNPEQQQFVEFLLTLKPLFDQLKDAASGFLPGLEQGIKDALPLFQPLLTVVRNVATALGNVFSGIGADLAGGPAAGFLTFLATELPKQVTFVATVFGDLGKTIANVFQQAGPLIDATDKAINGFFGDLQKSSGGGGLGAFFSSLIPIVKPIEDALAAITGGLGKIIENLVPAFGPLLKFIADLATGIGNLAGPVLRPLAVAFGDLLTALDPLIPVLQGLIEAVLPPFLNYLQTIYTQGFAPLVKGIVAAVLPVLPQLNTALTQITKALAPIIVQILNSLIPYLPQLAKGFASSIGPLTNLVLQLLKLASDVLPLLLPLLGPLFSSFNDNIKVFNAVATAVAKIVSAIDSLFNTVKSVLTPLVNVITGLFDALGSVLETTYDHTLKPFVSAILTLLQPVLDAIKTITNFQNLGNAVTGALQGGETGTIGSDPGLNQPIKSGKASGGPVFAGMTYPVGENGLELFTPQISGSIMDNHNAQKLIGQRGGNNIVINGTLQPEVVAQIAVAKMAAKGV